MSENQSKKRARAEVILNDALRAPALSAHERELEQANGVLVGQLASVTARLVAAEKERDAARAAHAFTLERLECFVMRKPGDDAECERDGSFDELFKLLVPPMGRGKHADPLDNKDCNLLRCAAKASYRWFNDGDSMRDFVDAYEDDYIDSMHEDDRKFFCARFSNEGAPHHPTDSPDYARMIDTVFCRVAARRLVRGAPLK